MRIILCQKHAQRPSSPIPLSFRVNVSVFFVLFVFRLHIFSHALFFQWMLYLSEIDRIVSDHYFLSKTFRSVRLIKQALSVQVCLKL